MKNKLKLFTAIFLTASLLTGCATDVNHTTTVTDVPYTTTVTDVPHTTTVTDVQHTTTFTEIASTVQPVSETEILTSDISAEVEDALSPIAEQNADYSVTVISLENETKNFQFSNCDSRMISASLIKLYVAGTVYENYDMVQAQESEDDETNHLLDIMISESDNDACNTLVTRLGNGDPDEGMNLINAFCQAHGFYDSQINRLMLVSNGKENYTSTADCCNILKAYYQNTLPGSQEIIGFMKNQKLRTKIPAGITDGTIVANKTGSLSTVENDAAIVYAESGVYFMSVISNHLSDTAEARAAIVKASEIVYESMQ